MLFLSIAYVNPNLGHLHIPHSKTNNIGGAHIYPYPDSPIYYLLYPIYKYYLFINKSEHTRAHDSPNRKKKKKQNINNHPLLTAILWIKVNLPKNDQG